MAEHLRDDPVLVMGMHHSGTSILARVLHHNGVFIQANMAHYESRFFTRRVNDHLVLGGEGNWARLPIMPVEDLLAKTDAVRAVIERKAFEKYVDAGYDGRSRWGFKDPRLCILLPLYLELFPNVRLLHIVRNEDDVAESLARSDKQGVGRMEDRGYGRELRRQHVARAREYGRRHAHYHEFAYEDFCDRPAEVTRAAFESAGVPFTSAAEAYVREHVRPLAARPPA